MLNGKFANKGGKNEPAVPLHTTLPTLKGRFSKRVAKPLSIAQMDLGIAKEASSRHFKTT